MTRRAASAFGWRKISEGGDGYARRPRFSVAMGNASPCSPA
jgi:hypothetical protein